MRLSFRVEVKSIRGALKGVPALLKLFEEYNVKATFLLSLGPDYTSTPLKYLLPWTLLTKFPVSRIGSRASDSLKKIADAGHEVGVAPFFSEEWRRCAAFADESYTKTSFEQSVQEFKQVMGFEPQLFGATGWQVNPYLLVQEEAYGLRFASDTRGKTVFLPLLQGLNSTCVQIPTTLPTIEEILASDSMNIDNVHEYLFAESQRVLPTGEVFSLDAEHDGCEYLGVVEKMIVMWKGSQWEFRTLGELFNSLDSTAIPKHQIGWDKVNGYPIHIAMQSLAVNDE